MYYHTNWKPSKAHHALSSTIYPQNCWEQKWRDMIFCKYQNFYARWLDTTDTKHSDVSICKDVGQDDLISSIFKLISRIYIYISCISYKTVLSWVLQYFTANWSTLVHISSPWLLSFKIIVLYRFYHLTSCGDCRLWQVSIWVTYDRDDTCHK